MKKTFYAIILCFIFSTLGCGSLALTKDNKGNPHTQLGDTMINVGKTMQNVGNAVPGYGSLIGLIGGLVVMAGGLVTSIKSGLSKNDMLDTMIKSSSDIGKIVENKNIHHKTRERIKTKAVKLGAEIKGIS